MTTTVTVEERARQSLGRSDLVIHERAAAVLKERVAQGGLILDVGCGSGSFRELVRSAFSRYLGIDVVKHSGFPADAEFLQANFDSGSVPLENGCADVVIAIETIEHLENPRAFVRELTRLAKPGGWILVTTPNQLSLLSKLTLLLKNSFNAFQASDYPAHITALLEQDLLRIARECGLKAPSIHYTHSGRMAFTPWRYPAGISKLLPRAFSDNVILLARKA